MTNDTRKHWTPESLIEEINRRGGVEKCRIQVPMYTGNRVPGFGITLVDKSGADSSCPTICRIDERRYKLTNMHKIELVPAIASDTAHYESFYLSDLCLIMERNPEKYCFVDMPENDSDETPHKLRIEAKSLETFMRKFKRGAFRQQRLGQAFVNTFRLDRVTDRNIYPRIEKANLWELDGEEAMTAIHNLCEFV